MADDAALRQWLMDQLNRRTVEAVAALCGVRRQALYQWLDRLRVRRVVRWEAAGPLPTLVGAQQVYRELVGDVQEEKS